MVIDQLRLMLQEVADCYSRTQDTDEFDIDIECYGSVRGAFELGETEGKIVYARHLLEILDVLEEGLHD